MVKTIGSRDAVPLADDMKLTEWRHMQGLHSATLICQVLQGVLAGDLTLQEMGAEFKRHKTQMIVQKAFLTNLLEESWSACKAKYTEHCIDDILTNFVPIFQGWKDVVSKKKKEDSDEPLDLKSFPEKFNAHIAQAQNWLSMKTSALRLGEIVPETISAVVFEHPVLGDIPFDIQQGDALKLHELVRPRPYTLVLADIPYEFSRSGCLHEDNVAWGVEEVTKLVQSFKVVTIAKLWRVIILHNIDQYDAVKIVLNAKCNGGLQSCVWIKDNVKNARGARLKSNFECFTIGFFSQDGKRSMEHFNFGPDECRNNVVTFFGVTTKLKHHGDNKVINIYQKPRRLLDWMVNHFSHVGDWVLDLCSGSGTGLAASLSLSKPCVVVELDARQSAVLRSRVLKLTDDLTRERERSGVEKMMRKKTLRMKEM
ncbi:unnamed protein product [Calypogeia fissa]